MPRAEVGSTKYIANKLKSKGLQRLRWYCQACERQMRDENGFKCHTQSESHIRQMMVIGEDPRKAIREFSNQFQRDFLQLLRTSHYEKAVHVNHFYQEYIGNKEHVHMNSTHWPSLTEFAKHLGREGLCRVEDTEKGLFVAYIDRSPEALRRQEALKRKERQEKGDEDLEQRLIQEQIRRARKDKGSTEDKEENEEDNEEAKALQRVEGEKIKLNFTSKPKTTTPPATDSNGDNKATSLPPATTSNSESQSPQDSTTSTPIATPTEPTQQPSAPKPIVKLNPLASSKPKNVFAGAGKKKNPLAGNKSSASEAAGQKRPMSEAERIMRAEMEKGVGKRGIGFGISAPGNGNGSGNGNGNVFKKQRVG